MAFNHVGHIWLRKGDTTWVDIWYGSVGEDQGAQWIMANPLPFDIFPTPSGTSQLESSRFRKRVDYYNGGAAWVYSCLVENTGSLDTWFDLSGGGNA